jgi:hypothetical protein
VFEVYNVTSKGKQLFVRWLLDSTSLQLTPHIPEGFEKILRSVFMLEVGTPNVLDSITKVESHVLNYINALHT